MFKRLLSYFVPVTVFRKSSAVSKTLEVTLNNGLLVLDSKNTNYSYGSLQRVLRKGLRRIGFQKVAAMREILVLGVAGGSVIKTLTGEIGCNGKITGVEIDAEVIEIANRYFKLDRIPNLEIVIDDAFEFVLRTKTKYDLIIVDLFQDMLMPSFAFEPFFADRLGFLLEPDGYILFNTMTLGGEHDQRNEAYVSGFDETLFEVSLMPRIESHNELILIRKKT
jgi:spermidine synthase